MSWGIFALQTLSLPTTEVPPRLVFDGIRAASLGALAAGGLVSLLASSTSQSQGRAGAPAQGRHVLRTLLGLVAMAAAAAAVTSPTLEQVAVSFLVLSACDLAISVRGRRALPAWIVGLLSPVALFVAARLRIDAGGDSAVDWIGTPFSGDLSTTLAFLAMALPLALPGALGGVWAGLSCGPDVRGGATRSARFGYGLTAFLRPVSHGALLSLTFAGSEALLQFGSVAVWAMPVVALLQRCAAHQLGSLVYAAFWALLAGQGAASSQSADAFAVGLLGLSIPIAALAVALALVRSEQAAYPGLAPEGVAQLFPLTFWASLVSVAAAAGAPFLGAFHGRAQTVAALESDGKGAESLGLALAAAPLLALVALPWMYRVFITRPRVDGASAVPQRRKEPKLFLLAVVLAAAASLALGVLPEIARPLLPFGDLGPEGVPTPFGQLQLLMGAGLVASFFKGRIYPPEATLSSTP